MQRTRMFVSALVFVLCVAISAYSQSWIHAEDGCPDGFSISPDNPTTSDLIYFSGPTETFSNDCYAGHQMGRPTINIDYNKKIIELVFEPLPPGMCIAVWDPVCGIEGSFGPLEEGSWTFNTSIWGTCVIDVVSSTNVEPPTCSGLSEALDTTLSFSTGGVADWFCQSDTFYYNGFAAQSGDISNNQASWMNTIANGPGTLSFYWKVSSEDSYDFLEFYIDGVHLSRISGSADWQKVTYAIPSGSHNLLWKYSKDNNRSLGSDCGWVDKVEWISLSEALDTALSFSTGGNSNWFYQIMTSYYDGDAAQSGSILNNQESWIQTIVYGQGTLSFYWKVSSEAYRDYLEFYIDGSLQNRISGSVDWQKVTYDIPSGSHALLWRYVKNGSVSLGNDCGWLDKIEWISLSQALDTTLSINTGGNADWFYQTIMYYYDGDAAQSGGISHNQESWMQIIENGPGTLSFFWKVSSERSYDFLEFYMDGVRRSRISGTVDWQQKAYAISSGLHILVWRYIKDGSVSLGSDCGWVDWVQILHP